MSVPIQGSTPYPSLGRIDFGWIGQAWALFSAQAGVWVGAMVLTFLVYVAAFVMLLFVTGEWPAFLNSFASGFKHGHSNVYYTSALTPYGYLKFAVRQAREIVLAGINAVFLGGLYRTALRQKRGEPISVFGLFSVLPQSLPLFLIGIVVPVVLALIEGACLWPLHHFFPYAGTTLVDDAYLFLSTLLGSVLLFAPLLVLDAHAGVPEALLGSVRLLRGQMLRGLGFYLCASFIGASGLIGCCVGMLATYPIFILSITIGYLVLTQPFISAPPEFDPAPPGVWPPPPNIPSSIPSRIIPPGERE